jgi:hypothetical protein
MKLMALASHLLFLSLATTAYAGSSQVNLAKSLAGLKYQVIYPSYLPTGYRITRAEKEPRSDYQDYLIEFCDKGKKSCCTIGSGHELGDPLLNVSDKTQKKKVKSKVFGEVTLYLVSAKENQEWLEEYVHGGEKSPTYKKNVAQTDWMEIKGNAEAVSYNFSCYGVSNEQASKVLEGLRVLQKK